MLVRANKIDTFAVTRLNFALAILTPDGLYHLRGQYLLACDGANSQVRRQFGLEFDGRHFEERFLIADVEMEAESPTKITRSWTNRLMRRQLKL